MANTQVSKGDVGVIFRITLTRDDVPMDISAATKKQISFKLPNGNKLTKNASFGVGGGADGILEYKTVAGDLSIVGSWELQAYVEIEAGKFHSTKGTFAVSPIVE